MVDIDTSVLLRNNTGNKTKESLVGGFVVRTGVFNRIYKEVRTSKGFRHENYLIIGQRGAGKTTLLYRLKYAFEDDAKLMATVIPIMFSEEQYNLLDLYSLWQGVADYLEEFPGFDTLPEEISTINLAYSEREAKAFEILQNRLLATGKTVTLFIENIDVFFKKLGKEGQARFKSVLVDSSPVRLICSSTVYFESVSSPKELFHDFFEIIELRGLSKTESSKLLYQLAGQFKQLEKIKIIITNHPKRLESLRRLTGGNPRIISYLFQIFLDNENGKAIIDLYKLLDDITFLYKAELDQLSPQQQRVIDSIARNWDAISTKEMSVKTGIEGKQISSILNVLEKNQVIEIVPTKTKNNLYRLKDRFLNIWYLMRFGRNHERADVVWLVRFYDVWCDQTELSNHINEHIKNLKNGQYDVGAALDMGNVFLSCANVPGHVKYDIYKTTKSILPLHKIKELKLSRSVIYDSLRGLVEDKKFDEAIEVLNGLNPVEKYYDIASWVYYMKGDLDKSVDLLVRLYDIKPSGDLAMQIAGLYETQSHYNKSIQYYKLAISDQIWEAYYHLGTISYNNGNLEEAEDYFLSGINNGVDKCYNSLAAVYYNSGRLDNSAKLLQEAIANGNTFKSLKINLALIYHKQLQTDKAIALLHEVINQGDLKAYVNLATIYITKEEPDLLTARMLLEEAIDKGYTKAYHHLARLYLKEDNIKQAEYYLFQGYERKDAESAHLLGHFYCEGDDWLKGEEYFISAIKWGKLSALMCLGECILTDKRNDRKTFILKLFKKYQQKIHGEIAIELTYIKILIWSNNLKAAVDKLQHIGTIVANKIESRKSDERFVDNIINDLTTIFIMLMAKEQYGVLYSMFSNKDFSYKSMLRPVYFSLMNFMKDEFPNEYLKPGAEFRETVNEIINKVFDYRKEEMSNSKQSNDMM
ncbi:hypothetical protein ACLI08_05215 [Flavobacterium sp. RNTU_13]|uniref:hypothetical protein n=1 Tax=Flavobacterium sp. RNTU_13 TaxID=3375145 RepID=UPI003985F908